ncbi:OGT [Branchiostoma lanceolatum]|uniref:OGT protein n=1 Tax=Branchiostoma lanceolatum TaxID=7740 RepID=A0A8J9ZU05_BRALA|nr:OGT [Branchiostoma lanceolatum]
MATKELEQRARDALDREQLGKAEEFFAQALRLVTGADTSHYGDQIRPLVGLGDVYQQRPQAESIVKAAALYNAALPRCRDEFQRSEIRKKISEIDTKFVREVCQNVFINPREEEIERERHISSLASLRNECKAALSALSPVQSDNPSDYVQRANDVHNLHVKIAAEIREMVKRMIKECMAVMGPPPCQHAIIGLGSLAREETTPYSDLEFAILVEEGGDSEPNIDYFRLLTHYLHLKVVNLGETILPAVGIRSLNDFYSGNAEDDWFFDEITPQGFAFDGAMPWASKVPTGRGKTKGKDALEFIRTPKNMAALQTEETTLKEGYHVADVLSSVVLIDGQEELVQEYRREMMTILTAPTKLHIMLQEEESREVSDSLRKFNDDPAMLITMHDTTRSQRTVMEQRAVQALAADMETYDDRLFNLDESGKLLHVKKEIYRLPSTLLEGLARFYGVMSCSSWERIEELQEKGVLSAEAAQNLKVAVAISMELRLKCYLENGSQRGLMNVTVPLQIKEEKGTDFVTSLFHIQDPGMLVAFYSVLLSLREAIEETLCDPSDELASKLSQMLSGNVVDNGPKTKGLVYSKLLQNRLSLEYFRQADEKTPRDTGVLDAMGNLLHSMAQFQDALQNHQASLDVKRHTDYLDLPENIATSHMMIGRDLLGLGRAHEAVVHQRKALELLNVRTLEDRPSKLAATYINLGLALEDSGRYLEADECYQKVIETLRMTQGNPLLAKAFNNRGSVASKLGKRKDALTFYKKALDMQLSLFGKDTAHPDIATGYNNIGTIYITLGEEDKALEALQRSLYIKRRIHGDESDHPSIAASMVNIAALLQQMDRHRESLIMSEHAEAMLERLGQTQSLYMATAMGVTGKSLAASKMYKKEATQKLLGAATIMESKDVESRGLAQIQYELGSLYRSAGSKMKGLACLQRSVQLFEKFTDTSGKDSSLAHSLARLASAYYEDAEYPAAVLNFRKALRLVPEDKITRKATYSRNLGQALQKTGQVQEAVDTTSTSMELLESVPDEDRGNVLVGDFEAALAAAHAAAGQFSLAYVYYDRAHAKYSMHGEYSELPAVEGSMCTTVYLECASLVREGKVEEAREILEESEEDPGEADLYRRLANTMYNKEGLAETIQFLETVVYLDPKDRETSSCRRDLARMYHVQARLSKACGNAELASKMRKQANDEYHLLMCGKLDLSAMTEYGTFLCLSQKWEEAMFVLLQVVAEDCQVGSLPDITFRRLDLAVMPGELKSELKNQKEGKLHVPCRHLAYFLLTRAFLESENQRGADQIAQVFGREVQGNVNSSISWSLLGYALWRVGRHLEASAAFTRASSRMEETTDFDLTANNWAVCIICAILAKSMSR